MSGLHQCLTKQDINNQQLRVPLVDPLLFVLQMKRSRFLSFYPLVPICLAFILGIVCGDRLEDYAVYWHIAALVAAILFFLVVVLRRFQQMRTLALLVAVAALGTTLALLNFNRLEVDLPDDWQSYEAVIISEPVERDKNVRFDMKVLTGPLAGHSVRTYLQHDSVTGRHTLLRVGTGLVACSRFRRPVNRPESDFDYVRYLQVDGIVATTYVFDNQWVSDTVSLRTMSSLERSLLSALRFRHDLLKRYEAVGLDGDAYALATAMTFGNRNFVSEELQDTYAATGVAHILSLSGLHLGIIYALLCFLTFGKRRRTLRQFVLLLAIWTYVLIAGAHPSLIRSALMITIYSIIAVSDRNPLSLNVLAFAALIMLVVNPLYIYDVGFQLSFLSVGAIMLLHGRLSGIMNHTWIEKCRISRWVWHSVVMSLSAQLATAPLVAYYFDYLPVYFLMANIIAIPLTTLILYFSIAVLGASFIPILSSFLASALTVLVTALNVSMAFIASWPCASIEGIEINTVQVLWIYFTLICLCLLIRKVYNILFPTQYKLSAMLEEKT